MNGSSVIPDSSYFQRQMRLPGIGITGQRRLQTSHALVVGLGALGCPVVTYLARAGVGRLTLFDGDHVAYHNLHRQTLYGPQDVEKPKAGTVAAWLRSEHPSLLVDEHDTWFDGTILQDVGRENALPTRTRATRAPVDIILDCTDRFSSRFIVHDAAHRAGVDLVSAAVTAFSGQIQVLRFSRDRSPCLRCLYPEAPPDGCTGSCAEDGILGAAAGTMGSLQALTALRVLLGMETMTPAAIHSVDLAKMTIMTNAWDPDPACPCCGVGAVTRRATAPFVEAVSLNDEALKHRPGTLTVPENGVSSRIIDLREPWEVTNVDRLLLPSAELIPLERFLASLDQLDHSETYVLACEHGVRSEIARDRMRTAGFPHVVHVAGGFSALRERLQ